MPIHTNTIPAMATPGHSFLNSRLHIMGLGSNYPENAMTPQDLRELAYRHYPRTPLMEKLLSINDTTGIETRSVLYGFDDPIYNGPAPVTIDKLSEVFLNEGVQLAVGAARKAIEEWGGNIAEITHVVATTCTNSANPGYDYYVARELGLGSSVQRTLLHGIGCAGGLAALRTAANIALGMSFMRVPARILVVSCELTSLFVRSELESIQQTQDLRAAVALYSDCSSALILSNGIGEALNAKPVYDLIGWEYLTLPNTDNDVRFDVNAFGWTTVLNPRVTTVTAASTLPLFSSLIPRIPSLRSPDGNFPVPGDFDWCMHGNGKRVFELTQNLLSLSGEHLRASYDVYKHHGHSSSATVISVMDRLRQSDMGPGREHVVSCAFGTGITVEMCILKRHSVRKSILSGPEQRTYRYSSL